MDELKLKEREQALLEEIKKLQGAADMYTSQLQAANNRGLQLNGALAELRSIIESLKDSAQEV